MSWTEARVEKLKDLWAAGYSASQIAEKLGGFFCVDGGRSAVIGKAYRLKLAPRTTANRSRVQNANAAIFRRPAPSVLDRNPPAAQKPNFQFGKGKKRAIAASNAHPVKSEPGPDGGVTFADLRPRQCKFELSSTYERPENFRFCGARTELGSPYCEYHSSIAYNYWARKREKAA